MAIAYHYKEIFELLYEHLKLESYSIKDMALLTACQYGHLDILVILLAYKLLFLDKDLIACIEIAVVNGHPGIVDLLLLEIIKSVSMMERRNTYNWFANHIRESLKKEIGHWKLFPSYNRDYDNHEVLLSIACREGSVDVVESILNCGYLSLKPLRLLDCLNVACHKGQLDIVKLLLAHHSDRFALSIESNLSAVDRNSPLNPLSFASSEGHVEVVKYLLRDKRINPAEANNQALKLASTKGHLELVKLLFNDPRVSSVRDNEWIFEALGSALAYGYKEIVSFLFSQKGIRTAVEAVVYAEGAKLDHRMEALKTHCDYLRALDKMALIKFGVFADSESNLQLLNEDIVDTIGKFLVALN